MAARIDEGLGRQIERRSIDYVPEDERNGKLRFWVPTSFAEVTE